MTGVPQSQSAAEAFEQSGPNLNGTSPVAYTKKLPDPSIVYVVDFFCGCGGMSYGFATTRQSHLAFKILAGIDKDPAALETFKRNTDAVAVRADIATLAEAPGQLEHLIPGWIPSQFRPLVFIGCPPCQGFSAMRKGDDRDDMRNSLILAFVKMVSHYKPDAIVIENVPQILKGRFSEYFRKATQRLEKAGYKLQKDVLDLSGYGVPQRRKRAIVTGSLSGSIALPAPILPPENGLTVRHAISHLRPVAAGECDPDDPAHRAPKHSERMVEVFKAIPADGGDRRSLPAEMRLKAHVRLDRSDAPGFTDVYGRLRWDTPSVTITAKSRHAGSGRFLHPEQHRNITPREAAILQGFPQSFKFAGSPTQQYRQVGEAVPPLFARFVGWQILSHFSETTAWVPSELVQRNGEAISRNPKSGLALIEGFCGAGGMGLGFKMAGINTAFAFDADADAVRTFQRNVSSQAEVFDINDPALIRTLNENLPDTPFCIAAGPPCQGFSHQRRGEAADPRNRLIIRYADVVAKLRVSPVAIVLENVTDLELPRGREILQEFLRKIRALGFRDFRHTLVSTDYGVPQLRHRIIIVAIRETFAKFYSGPVPLTATRWPTIGEALWGLPDATDLSAGETKIANHEASGEGALNKRRIAFVDMGSGRKAIPVELQLPCHAASYRGHRDVYGRLDWFSQARTLTGGFDSFTRGEYAHPFLHRSITAREAARLQGFPDDFVFEGNRAAVRKQIGNAVPPPMAYAIAAAIRLAVSKAMEKTHGRTDSKLHNRAQSVKTHHSGIGERSVFSY
jgi:DNA (cytosine-5)-methyltransferase 1